MGRKTSFLLDEKEVNLEKIPASIAIQIPFDAISKLLEIERGVNNLEKNLKLSHGTLSKTMNFAGSQTSSAPARGISRRVHAILLEHIAEKFSSGTEMQRWMQTNWPRELLERDAAIHAQIYEQVDMLNRIPNTANFPKDYVDRDEEQQILDQILNNKDVNVILVTGIGGIGKTTLVTGLIRKNWKELQRHFKNYVFWVNAEQADFKTGLKQIEKQLTRKYSQSSSIEQDIHLITRKHKTLIVLDGLHEIKEFSQWQELAGYLGRLIITSRMRKMGYSELAADSRIIQIELEGFTKEQTRKFLVENGKTRVQDDQVTIQDDIAKQLFDFTGGHPLALRLIKDLVYTLKIPVSDILSNLSLVSRELSVIPSEELNRHRNPYACFKVTWDFLEKEFPQNLYYFLAIGAFLTHNIPSQIFEKVVQAEETSQKVKAKSFLYRLNIPTTISVDGLEIIHIHPLLHEFVQEKLNTHPDAIKIKEHYWTALIQWLLRWDEDFVNIGIVNPEVENLLPDLEYLAKTLTKQPAQNILEILKALTNLLQFYSKQDLLKSAYEEFDNNLINTRTQSSMLEAAYASNMLGIIALEKADLSEAERRFKKAIQLLENFELNINALPRQQKEQVFVEKFRSILKLSITFLNNGNVELAYQTIESLHPLLSQITDNNLRIEFELTRIEIAIGRESDSGQSNPNNLLRCLYALRKLNADPFARRHYIHNFKNFELRAECYRELKQYAKAARLYKCLFYHPSACGIMRFEYGLRWASVTGEAQDFEQVLKILEEIEPFIVQDPRAEARFWKYKTIVSLQQRLFEQTIKDGEKALIFYQKIPASDDEQKRIRDLISQAQEEIKKQARN